MSNQSDQSNQLKEIHGAWLAAIGTILVALGSTPNIGLSSKIQRDLDIVGNALEALGSGLAADGQALPLSLEYASNVLSSIGAIEIFTAAVIDFPATLDTKMNIQGELLQAVGTAISAADGFSDNLSIGAAELFIGNVIQTIGSVIQVLGITIQVNEQDKGQIFIATGSWTQAIGAVLSAIGQQLEGSQGDGQG